MSVPLQLSSSSSSQIVHQILPEGEKPNTMSPSKTPYSDKVFSIEAVCLHIFTFLADLDLIRGLVVNRSWSIWTTHASIWQARTSQDVRDDFAPLIAQDLVNHKEAYLCASLSHFVAAIVNRENSFNDSIRLKNPELGEEASGRYMPIPFVQYGNYKFAISNLVNIEVHETGNRESILLKGEKGKMLTHLAVEGNYLFALREDGIIVQLNYQERREIQKIDTAYFKGDEEFRRALRHDHLFCEFYVKNGLIIIPYYGDHRDPSNPKKLLEIIRYEDPTKRQLIEDSSLPSHNPILENDELIMLDRNGIWNRNLSTGKTQTYKVDIQEGYLSRGVLDRHVLYAINSNLLLKPSQLYRFDLKTEIVDSRIHSLGHKILLYRVIRDLVFGLSSYNNRIVVINMRSEKTVGEFSPVKDDPDLTTNLLKKLIAIAKKELNIAAPLIAATSVVATTPDPIVADTLKPEPQLQPKPKFKSKGCVIA